MDEITCDGVDTMPTETDERPVRQRAYRRRMAERDAALAELIKVRAMLAEMTEQRDRLAGELSRIEIALSGIEVSASGQLGTPSATDRILWLERKTIDQSAEIARLQERTTPWWVRLAGRFGR